MEDNSVGTNLMVPCQRITTTIDKNLIITSSGNLIRVLELSNGRLVSCEISDGSDRSSDSHTGLIRSLLVIENRCGGTDPQLLVSTGEDKLLKIWKLPTLSLISSRELVKRPTSIAISPDGKSIVIADKSGDFYDLPIDCPSDTEFLADPDQEEVSDESLSKTLKPIAGHVSVITSIALIPPGRSDSLLVTADRDEHVRLSNYPNSWSIYGYLLGHSRFVSALLWVDCEGIDGGVLLSGGGDDEVYVWDHLALKCRRRIAVGDPLKDGLKVWPLKTNWFNSKRNNKRKAQNNGDESESQDKNQNSTIRNQRCCCINKIICTRPLDSKNKNRFFIITSVGSSTLAIIPMSAALGEESDQKVMFHDFMDPILDVIDVSSPSSSSAESGHSQIMVSLDTSVRSSNEPSLPLFRILSIDGSEVKELVDYPNLIKLNENASVTVKSIDEISKQEDLYPELLLFSKDQSIVRSNVKSFDDSKDEIRLGGRNGKKAEGRVIVQERVQKYLENMKSK
ncbi:WD40-repeat-containing domain protein [Phakopsora pachyrhizi]|uniref:WD40-repeat-containing domain protein n=1 Tax=Phakopsora pachyrhizi TaxID=170000 RepID=A0AAV0BBM1_PHAPC|nr:WD40-repeat-containing domain protein [Phakopsora pachyrhizi]